MFNFKQFNDNVNISLSFDDLLKLEDLMNRQINLCNQMLTQSHDFHFSNDLNEYKKWAQEMKQNIEAKIAQIKN